MRVLVLSVALALALVGSAARAELESGSQLKDMCFGDGRFAGDLKEVVEGIRWGYITGVADVVVAGNTVAGISVCAPAGPDGVDRGQIIEAAKLYLDDHRERLQAPAYVLVAEALREAFP